MKPFVVGGMAGLLTDARAGPNTGVLPHCTSAQIHAFMRMLLQPSSGQHCSHRLPARCPAAVCLSACRACALTDDEDAGEQSLAHVAVESASQLLLHSHLMGDSGLQVGSWQWSNSFWTVNGVRATAIMITHVYEQGASAHMIQTSGGQCGPAIMIKRRLNELCC